MSFLLQGNARSLSFNGEAKALSTPSSPGALGKPRVRKPSRPPHTLGPQPTTRMGDPPRMADAPIRTRDLAERPNRIPTPIPGLHAARNPYGQRQPMDSFSDEDPTTALGHEDRDVMPGGRFPAKPLPAAGRPIPHFRGPQPNTVPPTVVVADTGSSRMSTRPGAAWLGWLVASVVLGVASFHYTPTLFAPKAAPAAHVSVAAPAHAR